MSETFGRRVLRRQLCSRSPVWTTLRKLFTNSYLDARFTLTFLFLKTKTFKIYLPFAASLVTASLRPAVSPYRLLISAILTRILLCDCLSSGGCFRLISPHISAKCFSLKTFQSSIVRPCYSGCAGSFRFCIDYEFPADSLRPFMIGSLKPKVKLEREREGERAREGEL